MCIVACEFDHGQLLHATNSSSCHDTKPEEGLLMTQPAM